MSINIGGDLFLSTPSARRATGRHCPMWTLLRVFLSTPSARRATRDLYRFIADFGVFLSTPSARRATFNKIHKTKMKYISIHALREEGDLLDQFLDSIHISISIHALREEGDDEQEVEGSATKPFLSTPSARRATRSSGRWSYDGLISIHALREEGDPARDDADATAAIFLSTPSARRATWTS